MFPRSTRAALRLKANYAGSPEAQGKTVFQKIALHLAIFTVFMTLIAPASAAPSRVSCDPGSLALGPREALLIVNDTYSNMTGAAADLEAMRQNMKIAEATLCKTGFDVWEIQNGSDSDIAAAIQEFNRRLSHGGRVGLIYYTGHGVRTYQDNIVLTNVDPSRLATAFNNFVMGWNNLVEALTISSESNVANDQTYDPIVKIIIYDACRDVEYNGPFVIPTHGVAQDPLGSIYIFAAGDNTEAIAGIRSPTFFSERLFHYISTPGSSVSFITKQLAGDIRSLPRPPDYQQDPRYSSSIDNAALQFVFVPDATSQSLAPGNVVPTSQPAKSGLAGTVDLGLRIPGAVGTTLRNTVQPSKGKKVAQVAQLVTDHRYNLFYWRARPKGATLTDPDFEAFAAGLRALEAGDMTAAYRSFQLAAASNAPDVAREARTEMGWMAATGRLGEPNVHQAIALWVSASDAGSGAAADSLGVVYRRDSGSNWGVRQDLVKSFGYFVLAARRLPAANNDLAYMFAGGLGVARNEARARRLYAAAAAVDDPQALQWLSHDLWATEPSRAQTLLRRSAFQLHDPQAVTYWARRVVAGEVSGDLDELRSALSSAAETGYPPAQYWYAWFLECDYARRPDEGLYGRFRALLLKSAQGGYDQEAAGGPANAVDEFARLQTYERIKAPFQPVAGCPTARGEMSGHAR